MSALCTANFKARGVTCARVDCDGHLPVLYAYGEFICRGKLALHGQLLPCELGAALPSAYLHLGDGVSLSNGASVIAYCGIEIGDNTAIGDYASIYDTNHHALDASHPVKYAPVVIGSNVQIGTDVTVLPGSKIGDHTVVSAGSVVRGDLPSGVLATGSPAEPVRELDLPLGGQRR